MTKQTDPKENKLSQDWTDTHGIAKITGLSVNFFYKDRQTRLLGIPFIKLGKNRRSRILYNIKDVDAFFKAHEIA